MIPAMDWLARNWVPVAGLLSAGIGLVDLETTQRAGTEWDRGLILSGISLVAGFAVPAAQRAVAAALRR